MKKILLFLAFFVSLSGFSQNDTIDLFKHVPPSGLLKSLKKTKRNLNRNEAGRAKLKKRNRFKFGNRHSAEMTEFEIFAHGAKIKTTKTDAVSYKKGKHYVADKGRFGAVSISDDGTLVTGKLDSMTLTENGEVPDSTLALPYDNETEPTIPGTPAEQAPQGTPLLELKNLPIETERNIPYYAGPVSCKHVRMYFEISHSYFLNAGSVQKAVDNFSSVFAQVAALYIREGIIIQISSIKVWDTPDPYISMTSSSAILLAFATNNYLKPEASTYDLGHFIDFSSGTHTNLGGIAYTGGLNNPNAKYGYSNIFGGVPSTPSYSWTVGCIAHEIGHNFGSKHTQWCGWELSEGVFGPIDSCAQCEPVNGVACRTAQDRKCIVGTIMSYCHICCCNGGIDFSLGFGLLPGNAIRSGLAISNVPCVGTPPPPSCVWALTSDWGPCQPDGFRYRTAASTPVGCTGPNPFELKQSCINIPPCIFDSVCVNGAWVFSAKNSPCTGCFPTNSKPCTIPLPFKVKFTGTTFTGNNDLTVRDTLNAIDGKTSTRYLTSGPCTITYTFSQPVTRTSVTLVSGYNNVDFNETMTLVVDGVNVPLNYVKSTNFVRGINVTGREFRMTTTGKGNVSRILEYQLR